MYKHGPYPGLWWWNQAKETMPKLKLGFNVNQPSGDPMGGIQYGCGNDKNEDRGSVGSSYGDTNNNSGNNSQNSNGSYNPFKLPSPN